ncbi:hypothetical protein BUALT_Bualt08G0128300 [Buddleja alternifolia]|uniref:non-specific serine/threonine protein kinase n=1 Tax=Buddleja alternifolia TaxID=168488 RepID=A0AAV6X6A9_9LAMI|nr:hypothetical protein BUALT_Bualt08G0128300 [Buddleja alternifolia]
MENSCVFIVVVTLVFLECPTLCSGINSFNSSTDQDALLAFKATITSDPYGILANNWSTNNTSVCYWIGVSCGIKHQRVTALNFSGFDLGGAVAPHLGNLTFLRSLDISFNNFTGILPDELSNLRRLKEINVGFNAFAGEIPSWLGILHELQHIYLNNNTFTGSIPPSLFNSTSKLLTLDIGYNFLGGNVPQEIGNFSSLETLNLQYNHFTAGSMPHGIFKVSSIRAINLRGCSLSDMLPSDMCNSIPKLKMLYLSRNQLFGQIPPNIYKCRDLEDLRLSYNHFDGNIPSEIGSLVNLKILSLVNNSFGGAIPKHLGNITSLNSLYLFENKFTGELPQELSNLAYLEYFDVSRNVLSGTIPSFMFNISTLKIMSVQVNHFSGSLPSTIGMGLSLLNLEELYLDHNTLSGAIPNYITNASRLTLLQMHQNSFSGSVPNFGNLRLLQRLRIRENNLTGDFRFLSSLANCQYLQVLQISTNPLNGVLPTSIGNLSTSLQDFSALECNIMGAIPFEIGNLSSLQILRLNSNQLTGELPQELRNLAYLEELSVGDNALSGSVPSFMFNISTLKYLDLASNHFSGSLLSTIGMGLSLLNLEELDLRSNRLSGPIPSYINNASKLTLLQMQNNSFSGYVPNFGNLRLLQKLRIWGNNVTGDLRFLSSLTNCRYLQVLQISANPLNGVLPTSIGNLSTSLQEFHAAECNIMGAIPSEIGNLSSLRELVLVSNQLTGFIPTTIGKLKQLQGIYLYDNRLQGYIPPDLCKMRKLVYLSLNGNMLTGPIHECLGELKTLRLVDLGLNNLNSTIPSSFWNLIDLLTLNLSSNNLSGQISPDIGSLKVINSLDLSWNQFSGDIPSSIGNPQSIEFLSLAHNKFEGSIPESLKDIINLRLLDLSDNNLSGVIPKSLESLRYLEYFNVSCNKLEGEIPTGGPFVNFTAQSFIQNSALCGATRFHVPLCVRTHKRSRPKNVFTLLMNYVLPPIISTIILVVIIIVLIRRRRRKHNKVPPPTNISLGIGWRRISYQELVLGTSAFSETNLLGRGGFGSVFRGILSDGLNVAIKVFNLQLEGASKSFDIESEILSTVRHRNLIRIIGCCCNTEFKALILAYMPNGSLEKWLYSESYCLDILQRVKIAIDVALGLEYLHHDHTFPVVHCDMKPSNILLDEDMTAHVADFGLSKLFDDGEVVIQTNTLATIGYTAPEYGSEGKVSTNGDVYSYGILLLEMFTMKKPTDDMFNGEMSLKNWVGEALLRENAVHEVVAPGLLTREDQKISTKEQCVSSVFRLAMECLAFSPEERINMIQIVAALQKIKTTFLASNIMR